MTIRNMTSWAAVAAGLMMAGTAIAAPPAPDFVKMAGASDMFEKQSSQAVLASTHDAKVRSFAQMMIKDHTKSTSMVKMAAMKSGLHPKPPMLMDKQKDDLAALKAAHGQERDRLYIEQQKPAHQDALALMQDYGSSGDKQPLMMVANKIVPVVQHHIEMLNAM